MRERLVVSVQGMDCAGCERRLVAAVRRVEGVREAAADHTAGVLEVELAPGADRHAVTARVTEAGYTVTDVQVR